MIAGPRGAPAGAIAVDLARQVARRHGQVILLDWSLEGKGLGEELGGAPALGVADVLSGRASFEDVVERLAGSEAHVIAAGSSAAGKAAARDKDRVNMLLDALDEAYDHVMIAGEWEALRDLFALIEGRVDIGVALAGPEAPAEPGTFLGFTVAELEVVWYEPMPARVRAEPVSPALAVR
jgi:MinD-like ATPase involved in chromosome partitioning or flagellar assembly